MNVAFFTISPSGKMYSDLIHKFIEQGHNVTIYTPYYNGIKRINNNMPHLNVVYFKSLTLQGVGIIRKGIANLLLPYICLYQLKKHLRLAKFDLVLMTTPPLAFYLPIKYLKKWNPSVKFFLILRDIHPAGARFVGLDKYKLIYNYLRRMEVSLYKLTDVIGCMSPGNVKYIIDNNLYLSDHSKVTLLPNWEQCDIFREPRQDIRVKYNLEGKFVTIYGGNMGIPQNLEILLRLAKQKECYSDSLFLFIGKGTEKARLEQLAIRMRLSNVQFMDYISVKDYEEILKTCNIGFISLHPRAFFPNIPSKTLSYFAAKVPVLASLDNITDYGKYMLDDNKAGLWAYATDFKDLSAKYDILYKNKDLCQQMGINGYNALKDKFNVELAYSNIINALVNHNGDKDI